MAQTLARYPVLARLLVEVFDARFNPARDDETEYRAELAARRLARDFDGLIKADEREDRVFEEYVQQIIDERDRGSHRDC